MKKIALLLILALILSLCGCGSAGAPAAETNVPEATQSAKPDAASPSDSGESQEPSKEPSAEPVAEETVLPITGEYNLYSVEYGGEAKKPSEMNVSCTISLKEDGTGTMTLNGAENPLPKWEAADGKLTLYNSSGDPLDCAIQDGIVTIEMGDNYYWYLAHEGTGISDPEAGRQFDSMLYAVCSGIDGKSGAHLSYECHSDYMDSTSIYDVHSKDGLFYSGKTVKVSGNEGRTATFFKDGTVYLLYPDEMKGSVATTASAGVSGNMMLLDDLYQTVYTMAQRGDYTVGTRDVDGVTYKVEVFPETDYKAETVFYFDDAGKLVHVLEGAPKLAPDLGESFYTVKAIDTAVNDSLFDISGYTIEQ